VKVTENGAHILCINVMKVTEKGEREQIGEQKFDRQF
jgi:hypothetical protein